LERLGDEVRVELEHRAVSGIGIDDEVAIRKTPRQIVRVLAWHHAIGIASCVQVAAPSSTISCAIIPPIENPKRSTDSKPMASMNVIASLATCSIEVAGTPLDAPMPRLSNVIT
jgi:hypothetical protein